MNDPEYFYKQLKSHFQGISEDVLRKEWVEFNKYNKVSPLLEEYFHYLSQNNIRD